MNEMMRLSREAQNIKREYPKGTRICLNEMDDPFSPVPAGTKGTVVWVDDIGQIRMAWDNGRTLALVPGVDSFRKLTEKELLEEQIAVLDIDPNKMTDSARVSIRWDSYGIAVDFNYSYDEAEGYGESVLCFSVPYHDGNPDQVAWKEAQHIGHFLKEKYNLPLDVLKNDSFLKGVAPVTDQPTEVRFGLSIRRYDSYQTFGSLEELREEVGRYFTEREKASGIVDRLTSPMMKNESPGYWTGEQKYQDMTVTCDVFFSTFDTPSIQTPVSNQLMPLNKLIEEEKPALDNMVARAAARMKEQAQQGMKALDKHISFSSSDR